ncbi:MAG: glycosyltransferase family 4 protein [Lachnospiraceae bacterium]|nr:glycosyltransferase family 4 protein [Lachnospiraceae bacterium]
MKKIVYLMEYPLDLPGGAQLSTEMIAAAFPDHPEYGYESVVICPELLDKSESDYPFRVLTYPMTEKRFPNLLRRIKAFKKYISGEKPDLIHIEMSESLITYGFIMKKFPEIPFIYTDRGMYFGYRKRSRIFMDPVLKRASCLITTTEKNKGLWESNTEFGPVITIPNTVSSLFETYDEVKKKRGGRLSIGFAGRICVEKDWGKVPVILKELEKEGADYDVKLVLSLYERGDREFADDLKKEITDIIGPDRLEYHEDLTQEEMSDFYYGVDLFIMTSVFESFGKAAVEAMSRHCAVMSTNVGGLPEVIGKEENLYSMEDISVLTAYVKKVSADRDFLQREQEYFYNRYHENYTSDAYIKRHLDIYGNFT